ncbi:MAG: hypothetical protein ABH852_01735 [Methanobacteriota archaeon]
MTVQRGSKHCPRCGSTKLRWASGLPQLWSIYDCGECGYRGSLVIEDGKLAKIIRSRWMRKKEHRAKPSSRK